jgi:hypothetical protein
MELSDWPLCGGPPCGATAGVREDGGDHEQRDGEDMYNALHGWCLLCSASSSLVAYPLSLPP